MRVRRNLGGMTPLRVLVSGAGIAGPALAHRLHRQGHHVTLVERAATPRTGGQAVDLRGTGRVVIDRMGLMPQIDAITLTQHGFAWVDDHGRPTARMHVDDFGGEGIVSRYEVLRGDLAAVLLRALDAGVELITDDTVTALDQDDDGVTATFENTPPRRVDLVVGADGLHSPVRTLTFGPDGVHPLGGHTSWFTAPAAPDLPADLQGWFLMHHTPGGLVSGLRPGRVPGETKAGLSFRSPTVPIPHHDLAAWRAEFTRRFAGAGWLAPWLVEAMHHADDLAVGPVAQVRLPRWSRGRVVLLGDAGYSPSPLTGLGTSLALVGAHVLAGELAAARSGGATDHRRAFDRYEHLMRPYVRDAQQLPPGGMGGFAPRTRLAIRLQAASMRSMRRWPVRPLLERQFAKAGSLVLPDYPDVPARTSP